jgi:hypothetical protein
MKVWKAAGFAMGGAALGALLTWAIVAHKLPDADDDDAKTEAAQGNAQGLTLDADTQAAAGIVIVPVAAAQGSTQHNGYARALDISPLAALAADAQTARAAVAASQKEVVRLTALVGQDQSAAPRDLEAAQAQFAADNARLMLACRKIGLDFGAGLARLGCDGISSFVQDAAQGQAALLRIDMPQGAAPTDGMVMIGEGNDAVPAHVLGPAATADAQLQTPGTLALVRGKQAARLAAGRVLPARLSDSQNINGVLIPRTALIRADGGQFVYRAEEGGHFTRAALHDGVPMAGGWFFADGPLKPGDAIVVSGATTLLGMERGPQQAGDDD